MKFGNPTVIFPSATSMPKSSDSMHTVREELEGAALSQRVCLLPEAEWAEVKILQAGNLPQAGALSRKNYDFLSKPAKRAWYRADNTPNADPESQILCISY